MEQKQIRQILAQHGLKASRQRMRILGFLFGTASHPTAEEIFHTLHSSDPMLSMATVYNTLNRLTDKGVIRALDVRQSETRYDAALEPHGHFRCSRCGDIFNVPLPEELKKMELTGYDIQAVSLTLHGLCPDCRENK